MKVIFNFGDTFTFNNNNNNLCIHLSLGDGY